LKGKKVIAFSATSSISYERLINNIISRPLTLRFKTEYELIHGTSPIQDASITNYTTRETMMQKLELDIIKYYDQKPIIVIHDDVEL
jgi:hypothetical protein